MARRMSNRERMQRAAAEAAAKEREKTEKSASKSASKAGSSSGTRKRSTAKTPVRQRQMTVWKVFDNGFREIAVFPFPEKGKAEAEAARLTKETGKTHFVNDVVVPMEG